MTIQGQSAECHNPSIFMENESAELPQEIIDDWALVELFGHNKIAGKVKTVSLLGAPFIRVDVPASAEQKEYTRFYNPKSVYSISPTTKEIATAVAAECHSEPVRPYELPKLLKYSESEDSGSEADPS